jgi:hypothetical protein
MRFFLVCFLVVSACARVPDDVVFRCDDGGCPTDLRCVSLAAGAYCVRNDGGVTVDAGRPPDAGTADAGSTDGGTGDGGPPDAGGLDAGSDAGVGDAGADDAGFSMDAGLTDAGVVGGLRICSQMECNGLACGGTSPAGCLCGCGIGLTCEASSCVLPRLCDDAGWCYEHPLPQGGHLTAAWASSTRPLVQGVISAVWGGERGVIFEWDGLRTTITQLPSPEHTIVGFFETANTLNAVTNLAFVYRRANLRWIRSLGHVAPLDVNPAGSMDGAVPWYDPCPAFAATAEGRFLGCVTHFGQPRILRVDDMAFVEERLTGVPDAGAGALIRPMAFGELPQQTVFSLSAPGQHTLFKRNGGVWMGYPSPNSVSPVAAFATGGQRVYAGYEYGGFGTSTAVDGLGFYRFEQQGFSVAFNASVPLAGKTALLGATISYLLPDGGLELLSDGGVRADRDTDSLHDRRWAAGVDTPQGLLTVGAFGATALVRRDGNMALMSSNFALRPADLCGTPGGETLYATYSATWNEPGFYRPNDVLRLKEGDAFRGISRRLSNGSWSPHDVDRRPSDGGWRNSLDQCWVHDATLTTASPLALTSFFLDSGVRTIVIDLAAWRDAGLVLAPTLESLWAERDSIVVSADNVRGVVDEASDRFVFTKSPGTSAVFGIGNERIVTGPTYEPTTYRLLEGKGLAGLTTPSELLPMGFSHRRALFGIADAGLYVALTQAANGAMHISTRPWCAADAGSCAEFTPVAEVALRFPGPPRERVANPFISASRRLYWLRLSDDRLNYRGDFYSSRSATIDLEWADTFAADAGVSFVRLPSWVHEQRLDSMPYDLWSTSTDVLVKTGRGIISRPVP